MRSVPATSEAVFVCLLAKLVVVADQEVSVVGLIMTAADQFVRPFVAIVQAGFASASVLLFTPKMNLFPQEREKIPCLS